MGTSLQVARSTVWYFQETAAAGKFGPPNEYVQRAGLFLIHTQTRAEAKARIMGDEPEEDTPLKDVACLITDEALPIGETVDEMEGNIISLCAGDEELDHISEESARLAETVVEVIAAGHSTNHLVYD